MQGTCRVFRGRGPLFPRDDCCCCSLLSSLHDSFIIRQTATTEEWDDDDDDAAQRRDKKDIESAAAAAASCPDENLSRLRGMRMASLRRRVRMGAKARAGASGKVNHLRLAAMVVMERERER